MNNLYRYRIVLWTVFFQFIFTSGYSQINEEIWKDLSQKLELKSNERSGIPDKYRSLNLDIAVLTSQLSIALNENHPDAFVLGPEIILPLPDGSFSKFIVAVSNIFPAELAAKFPMIRTYTAKGTDDTTALAKLDITQWGFHAMIVSSHGWTIIDPAVLGNTSDYICYDRKYSRAGNIFLCETEEFPLKPQKEFSQTNILARTAGSELKTYRMAVACTGEYAAFFGGTQAGALSAIVTSVNRVSGVYELELAVRFVLIANNNLLVYTNSATDPYTNGSGSTMLGENQTNITNVIGSANYDIGHVFGIGSGGVASLGVVCSSTNKARGVTGNTSPVGDNFDIDYVAHEMGHQFGGSHTFNGVIANCGANRSSSSAYEVGSGTTIMAYAGICGADNTQPHSDAIFHARSFDQIQVFITSPQSGSTCPVVTSTGNTPPVINAGSNYTIPLNTPFILTGSATDANNDPLTYLWEEYDLGPAGSPNSPSGNAPIFRDFVPVSSPSRVFPRMQDIVRNTQTLGEILPAYARSLAFRLTVRDNRAGGGGVTNNNTPVSLTVVNTTTPFKVTIPNTSLTWPGNSSQTVTWDVSSTNVSPINCANVNILLSVDSGYTFPYTLISNTPNDGSQAVTIPNVVSNKARIKVESVGNIFFDFSNVNFTISCVVIPTVSIVSDPAGAICSGTSVTFTATPVNGGTTPVYQWKNGNTVVGSNSVTYTTNSLNDGNVITCIITSNDVCAVNPATSNAITMNVTGVPLINTLTPDSGGIGTQVTLNGSGFSLTSFVNFNGTPATFSVINNNQLTAFAPPAATSGIITVTTSCGSVNTTEEYIYLDSIIFNVRVLIEGFYLGSGEMIEIISPGLCDTVEVSVAGAATPYPILHTSIGTINIYGDGFFKFPGSVYGNSYYIVIKHRNALEIWSAVPFLFSSVTNSFDFSTGEE